MTPAATVLHNNSFLRAAATTYFSTPHVAHCSAHVILSFLCTTTTMPRRVDSEFKQYTDCIKQYITKKTHLASDTAWEMLFIMATPRKTMTPAWVTTDLSSKMSHREFITRMLHKIALWSNIEITVIYLNKSHDVHSFSRVCIGFHIRLGRWREFSGDRPNFIFHK